MESVKHSQLQYDWNVHFSKVSACVEAQQMGGSPQGGEGGETLATEIHLEVSFK